MKKLLILATAAFLVSGVAFATDGTKKGKEKKTCKKGDACCKKKDKTAKM